MTGKYFLFGYLLIKLMALVCKADGEPGQPGGFIMIATSNGSREDEMVTPDTPHTEDECMGYYDVMGQWDPPFTCSTGDYLYCCGTCGFRYCCTYRRSRLDQSTCKNNRTMEWMKTMNTPKKKKDPLHDPTKDKTNMVVYVICGVVAIMALVGIFTKLGLEKAHRPQRENMSRAVASVLQGGLPGGQFQGEDALGMHTQHYDARANNQGGQINNNVAPGSTLGGVHPYPALAQLAQVYEQKQQGKELSKYASLKAVAAKANGDYYSKRRLMVELPSKGLPLQPLQTMRTMNRTMSSNMTSNMGSNMASNMGSNMGSNMASNMGSNMASNMGSNMASNMSSNMGSNMGSNMNSAMTSLGPLSPEPVATYVTEMPSATIISSTLPSMHSSSSTPKPNGQKPKGGGHGGHSRGPVFLGMTGPGNMSGGTMSGTMSSAMSNAMSGTMSGAMSSAMSNAMSGTMSGAMSSAMSNAMSGTMSGAMSSTLSGAMTGRMADGSAPGSHHHRVSYSSNTLGGPGHGHSQGMVMGLKGWDGTETVGRRKAYGPCRGGPCTVEQVNELGPSRNHSHSQHFLPTQPYFVTNSKTEVTV